MLIASSVVADFLGPELGGKLMWKLTTSVTDGRYIEDPRMQEIASLGSIWDEESRRREEIAHRISLLCAQLVKDSAR